MTMKRSPSHDSSTSLNVAGLPKAKSKAATKGPGITKMKRPPLKESASKGSTTANGADSSLNISVVGGQGQQQPGASESSQSITAAVTSSQAGSDEQVLAQCRHCKKSVPTTLHTAHAKACLKEKQERLKKKREAKEAKDVAAAREKEAKEALEREKSANGDAETKSPTIESNTVAESSSNDKAKGARKTAPKATAAAGAEDGNKKSKKRKADGEAEKAPKPKKKKEEPKPKLPKPKGPVDVEKHCGVILPNGAQCARSLTCKSHSMGAKRAVPGRSLPYDMLLHAYQKKNQAKQQKAAIDANAPLHDEQEQNTGPIDSDEEKDAVMAGIARAFSQPVIRPAKVHTLRKYQYIRMKEMLSTAIAGNGGRSLFAVGEAAARRSMSIAEGEVPSRSVQQ